MNRYNAIEQLEEESTKADYMLKLLTDEQEALVNANIENLAEIGGKKEIVINQLTTLTTIRHGEMVSTGFPLTDEGAQNWLVEITRADPEQKLLGKAKILWLQLLLCARNAKEQNRINGLLIARHAVLTHQSIQALQAAPVNNAIYGPDGYTNKKNPQRTLVIG
jgi:flagella synthesis protein FlgN